MRDFILKLSHIEKPLIKLATITRNNWMGAHGIFVDLHGDRELFHMVVKVVETFKVGLFSLG
jgi:hypothetical protein